MRDAEEVIVEGFEVLELAFRLVDEEDGLVDETDKLDEDEFPRGYSSARTSDTKHSNHGRCMLAKCPIVNRGWE